MAIQSSFLAKPGSTERRRSIVPMALNTATASLPQQHWSRSPAKVGSIALSISVVDQMGGTDESQSHSLELTPSSGVLELT
jgi:hypothetical protein